MKRVSFSERLRYAFDNTMSRGSTALIAWLFLVSAAVIAVVSLVATAAGIGPSAGEPLNLLDMAWVSLMQALGQQAMDGQALSFRAVTFAVTLFGIFVVGMLIGLLSNGIQRKVEDLRKGRSLVVEEGHTVILGWTPQVFTIVPELIITNEHHRHSCIAILAEKDKVEMEDEIRERVHHAGRTRIVCRTGSPIDPEDLQIVNPQASRSIIILAPDGEDPDAQIIKSMLALTNHPKRRPEPYRIVAEIHDPKNLEVARLVGRDEAQLVLANELIVHIAAQAFRQSGLSVVYGEFLDFEGDEIYFREEPALVGKTFHQALLAYENSSLLGLFRKDGRVQLNPAQDTVIGPGDQVIAVSEDDDTVRLSGLADVGIDEAAIRQGKPVVHGPERTLILGWNRRLSSIVSHMGDFVAPGSEVVVVAGREDVGAEIEQRYGNLRNQTVAFRRGDTTDRRTLDSLAVGSFQHAIVLSDSDNLDPHEADARTLITLLHLRDIVERAGGRVSIVSEMLDVRNRELAEVTRADDFVVSDRLVSLMLAQLSQNPHLSAVFEDLFNPEGSELYMKPAEGYVALGRPVNFYTVVESAARRGEVALGYRLHALASDAAKSYGVCVNPTKLAQVTFAPGDRIIVLAEG